jgi:membrane protease YdiL (CAAX protease family)
LSGSTASLIGVTGVLAPVLEETIFRGFLMTSLTKWYSHPFSCVLIV